MFYNEEGDPIQKDCYILVNGAILKLHYFTNDNVNYTLEGTVYSCGEDRSNSFKSFEYIRTIIGDEHNYVEVGTSVICGINVVDFGDIDSVLEMIADAITTLGATVTRSLTDDESNPNLPASILSQVVSYWAV